MAAKTPKQKNTNIAITNLKHSKQKNIHFLHYHNIIMIIKNKERMNKTLLAKISGIIFK